MVDIFVQDESKNPYGTYKDRRSRYITDLAEKEGVGTLCMITSGNAGYSLAKFARPKGIRVISVIDQKTPGSIKEALRQACDEVIEHELDASFLKPEDVIALARQSDTETIWDVSNGFSAAYDSIIEELADREFDYLVCPVGSGEAFVGLYQGLRDRGRDASLIGVGVESAHSFATKLATTWTPYEEKLGEITAEGHQLLRLTEDEVRNAYEKYKDRYVCEPSSTVVWGGLEKLTLPNAARVVVINSGKGLC